MKKIILSTFALFAAVLITNAQTPTPNSVKVKVNVNLNAFQSIEIGSGATGGSGEYGDEVTLNYTNANDYRTGVSKNVAKQLKVSSVGSGYSVKAKLALDKATLTRVGADGAESIEAKDILQVAIGKGFTDATPNAGKAVTTTGTAFDFAGTGSSSVLDEELDVKYFGKPISQENLRTYFNNVS